MNKYLIGLAVVLGIALTLVANKLWSVTVDRDRQATNMANITKDNAVLTLTLGEYKKINTLDKQKLDSVMAINKIKLKRVGQATIINNNYANTDIVQAEFGTPVIHPEINRIKPLTAEYTIPVSFLSPCWSMVGEILSTDPNAKLNILERKAANSSQLIVTKERRFLFWITKKAEYRMFSDCGEVNFTKIDFVKK